MAHEYINGWTYYEEFTEGAPTHWPHCRKGDALLTHRHERYKDCIVTCNGMDGYWRFQFTDIGDMYPTDYADYLMENVQPTQGEIPT